MATLYLDRKGLELRTDGAALALYERDIRIRSVPLGLLERIVIRAETTITTGVLGAIAEAGIAIAVLSGRQGRRIATVLGRPHNDARIRLAQYAKSQEPSFRMEWACRFVEKKIAGQIVFLERALDMRPDLRKSLSDALDTLRPLSERCRNRKEEISGVAGLLGLEGAAQAAYLRGYTTLFAESLAFTGRNRQPPRDPVNACLSLGYTILHVEAMRAAHAAGLDPFIGFLHEIAFGRESLACDLIEPLRPRWDARVWELFRSRTLRAGHFREDKGACLLDKAGRAHFYEHCEGFMRPVSRILRRYCRALVQALMTDTPEFLHVPTLENDR